MNAIFNTSGCIRYVLTLALISSYISLNAQFSKYYFVNTPVCRSSYEQIGPKTIPDGSGGMIVVWYDKRNNSDYDIYAQRFNAFGYPQWTSNGVPVCRISGEQSFPVLVGDGSGNAIIGWIDSRSGNAIYAQKLNASGVRQWDTSGVLVCSAGGSKESLIVSTDFNGGAIFVWSDMRNDYDIVGQRVDASGNIVWTTDGLEICNQDFDQSYPSMTTYGDTGVIVAWQDERNGKKALSDIFAHKIDIAGTEIWSSNGISVCQAQDEQNYPVITTDDSGGAIICWQDKRAGGNDIYAQKLDEDGNAEWTSDGDNFCSASGEQLYPAIVRDNAGGAIISWRDSRTNSGSHIYAQRIRYDGTALWNTNGNSVCVSSGSREQPNMLEDSEGGAFIAFSDTRYGSYDLFIQKMNASGVYQYTQNGMMISGPSNNQTANSMCSDGYGGIMIAWADLRNNATASDIYTQNVLKDGNMGIVGEIAVRGNNININDNDNSPSASDWTDMGSTKTFTGIVRKFTIFNTGNDTLDVTNIKLSGTNSSNFTIQNITLPKIILARDSVSFEVNYIPTGIGVSNAIVNITNSDSNESTFNYAIRGTFKAPKIEVFGNTNLISDGDMSPSETDSTTFGKVRVNGLVNRTFVISSSGTDTLSISNIAISGTNSADFSFTQISYPRKLNGGKTMNLVITFNPSSTGLKTALITVTSNDPSIGVYDFAIEGLSVIPSISIKGNNRLIADGDITPSVSDNTDYGNKRNGFTLSRKFKIYNTGTDDLNISNINLDGPGKNEFTIQGPTIPNIILPGDSLGFDVIFSPINTGKHTATVTVSNDDANKSEYDFSISGNSILPILVVSSNGQNIADNDTFPDVADNSDYGSLRKGAKKTNRFTLKNPGTDTLRVSGVSMIHYGPQMFTNLSIINGNILPGDSADIDIEFQPTIKGFYTTLITISSDLPNNPQHKFKLQGRGLEPKIEVYGNQLRISDGSTVQKIEDNTDFDSLEINTSSTRNYRIVNSGDYNLTISSILLSGADAGDFQLQNISFPAVITPGDSLKFDVTFNPSTIGRKNAKISISSDDDNTLDYDFLIAGTAFEEPTIGLNESYMSFVNLFPNPANQILNVELPADVMEAEMSICNMQGQELVRYNILTGAIFTMNLDNLNAGVYIVNITTDGRSARYRLVVRR